jgi:hypothetical protein
MVHTGDAQMKPGLKIVVWSKSRTSPVHIALHAGSMSTL